MSEDKAKHAGGRPTKYNPKYCQEIIDFFSVEPNREREMHHINKKSGAEWTTYEVVANKVPFFSAFARKIGVSPEKISIWAKKYDEFRQAYNIAKALQKEFLVQNALRGLYPPASFIFTAKNITDMKEKQEVEHSGGVTIMPAIEIDGKPINPKVGSK